MALRVLWELSKAQAPLTFRALQEAAETNPSVLNARLGNCATPMSSSMTAKAIDWPRKGVRW